MVNELECSWSHRIASKAPSPAPNTTRLAAADDMVRRLLGADADTGGGVACAECVEVGVADDAEDGVKYGVEALVPPV